MLDRGGGLELKRVQGFEKFGRYAEAVKAGGGLGGFVGNIPLSHIWSAADTAII
jgi:hypothetical protein